VTLPDALAGETFEALVLDWDGTAVADRQADARDVRGRLEWLCASGVHVVVVSGTHVDNIDGQLRARPTGPGSMHLCLNRGSEVFEVTADGPVLVWRRTASPAEDVALDRAAGLVERELCGRNVRVRLVAQRLNRRKIDLIPEPAWCDPPKARIAELASAVMARLHRAGFADLSEVVALAGAAARDAGLEDPRVTSDVKHLEIGLTDKSDSARWIASWLADRGVTGALVMVVGDEFGPVGGLSGSDAHMVVPEFSRAAVVSVGVEPAGVPDGVRHVPGGPRRFLEILDAQIARRRDLRVPWIDPDPAWVVALPGEPALERVAEALGALANGRAGVRAAREEDGPTAAPLFLVNGVYTAGDDPRLLPGPLWTDLQIGPGEREDEHRLLDLRTGVLVRARRDESRLRTLRFVSAAHPSALVLRAEGSPTHVDAGHVLVRPAEGIEYDRERRGDVELARTRGSTGGGIAVSARDRRRDLEGMRVIERLGAWQGDPDVPPAWDEAVAALAQLERIGSERLLAEHREAWARRWADAEVAIEGAADDQLAARFAVFQLLAAASTGNEAAVGARGLSGPAYGGHVFWDSDVFVLPALAALDPPAARAMLDYRIRRLPAARAAAIDEGRAGARFPWESAASGLDVTPREAHGRHGELVPIRTAEHEVHIVADVAWAAAELVDWSGDAALLDGPGGDLLVEGARYWASRIRLDPEGRGHLDGVMGPDEYHEVVDDNAYTNVMARWNLRRGAALVEARRDGAAEAARWRELAETLVDSYHADRGLYEQFAGYWDLEPMLVDQVAPTPVAADLVLGASRVAGSQLIKQPDVMMLYRLVPDELEAGSLRANLAHYGPRTAHGSSLSPAIHALLLARDRQPDRALDLFRLAARLDLDDLTGTTAGGIHLGTAGGVWQALAHGFLGLRPLVEELVVDPCLPTAWDALSMRLRFHGVVINVRADHQTFTVACDRPVSIRTPDGATRRCRPPGRTFALTEGSST
jgi:trehalose/maltose hydrolase-like predicted phosphorylase